MLPSSGTRLGSTADGWPKRSAAPACGRRRLPSDALIVLDVGLELAEEGPSPTSAGGILPSARGARARSAASVMKMTILATSAMGCVAAVVVRSADDSVGSEGDRCTPLVFSRLRPNDFAPRRSPQQTKRGPEGRS